MPPELIPLLSGFFGAVIGAFATFAGTRMTLKHQEKLHAEKIKYEHKATTAILRFNFLSDLFTELKVKTDSLIAQSSVKNPNYGIIIFLINNLLSIAIASGDKGLETRYIKHFSKVLEATPDGFDENYLDELRPYIQQGCVEMQTRFAELMAEVSNSAFNLSD